MAVTGPDSRGGTGEGRRHELDWLRVIAFGLLIPFHVALGFLPWDIYGFTNNDHAGPGLLYAMAWMHQWRLALIFLVAGMGAAFAFRRRDAGSYIRERLARLGVPLLAGVLVLNTVPAYILQREPGMQDFWAFVPSYWSFLDDVLRGAAEAPLTLWTHSLHLWFLINLLLYALLLLPLMLTIRDGWLGHRIHRLASGPVGILAVAPLPLVAIELLVKPWAPGFLGTGYEFPWFLLFFLYGFLFMQVQESFWPALARLRWLALGLAASSMVLLAVFVHAADRLAPAGSELVLAGGWMAHDWRFLDALTAPAAILHAYHAWFWCMTFFAWATHLLDRPGPLLAYLAPAVYPVYLVHMAPVLVGLYWLKDHTLAWPLKFVIVCVLTAAVGLAFYEVVRRNRVTRFLFGAQASIPRRRRSSSGP